MVNVLSLPDDLLGRLAYPEGWHDFQWWITLRLGFQAPEMGLTGPVERGLIELNSNEWSVQACPDLIWEIPDCVPGIPRTPSPIGPIGRLSNAPSASRAEDFSLSFSRSQPMNGSEKPHPRERTRGKIDVQPEHGPLKACLSSIPKFGGMRGDN